MPGASRPRWIAIASGFCAGLLTCAAAAHADPNALWNIVHGQCVPDQIAHGDPKPCAEVDLRHGIAGGFAVLKDINGATQYLLIPTNRVGGIESPLVLAPGAPNYFADAWQARRLVEKALGHSALRDIRVWPLIPNWHAPRPSCIFTSTAFAPMCATRCGASARRSAGAGACSGIACRSSLPCHARGRPSLAGANPFKLLASGVPGARADMGRHTLVVVGMQFAHEAPGFVLLDDHADIAHGDAAGGEELQDHACALGR